MQFLSSRLKPISLATFSSRHQNLLALGEMSDKMLGAPTIFQRRLADGRIITVTGKYRKALRKEAIKKKAASIVRDHPELSLQSTDFKINIASTGRDGAHKFVKGEDPLQHKLAKWVKAHKPTTREYYKYNIVPDVGIAKIPAGVAVDITKPTIIKKLDLEAAEKRASTLFTNSGERSNYYNRVLKGAIQQIRKYT